MEKIKNPFTDRMIKLNNTNINMFKKLGYSLKDNSFVFNAKKEIDYIYHAIMYDEDLLEDIIKSGYLKTARELGIADETYGSPDLIYMRIKYKDILSCPYSSGYLLVFDKSLIKKNVHIYPTSANEYLENKKDVKKIEKEIVPWHNEITFENKISLKKYLKKIIILRKNKKEIVKRILKENNLNVEIEEKKLFNLNTNIGYPCFQVFI